MLADKRLTNTLLERLTFHKETLPVYRIRNQSLNEMDANLKHALTRFASAAGFGQMRYDIRRHETGTAVYGQEGITAHLYHASGAIALHRGWRPMENIISANAEFADLKFLQKQILDSVKRLDLAHPNR